MSSSNRLPGPLRFLYTHNPFYLLGACLLLYGIQVTFRPAAGELVDPWTLMAVLSGFTILSAFTAFLIVRLGKVWEDARSLVLILMLMFTAISVSFDEIVNSSPDAGRGLLMLGFALAVIVTEGLLSGLRVRFPLLYRVPYYAFFLLFFGYPLLVSPETTQAHVSVLRWRMLLFPSVAALILLALMPAVRRGCAYVAGNGTPWSWPLFPWSVFVFLSIAVCARSYVLCYSFDSANGSDSPFGLYALVPFAVAWLVVLLEMGIGSKNRVLQSFVMLAAPAVLLLAVGLGDGSAVARGMVNQLTEQVASPMFLTSYAVVAFYGFAWIRGVRGAEAGFIATLLLASCVGRGTLSLDELAVRDLWALRAAGVLELVLAMRRRSSWRCLLGVACCLTVFSTSLEDLPIAKGNELLPWHAVLPLLLLIGVTFQDRFAKIVGKVAACLLPLACAHMLIAQQGLALPLWLRGAYAATLTLAAFACWKRCRDPFHLYAGMVNVAGGAMGGVFIGCQALSSRLPEKAVPAVIGGTACFLLGVIISALKGGAVPRVRSWWRQVFAAPEPR